MLEKQIAQSLARLEALRERAKLAPREDAEIAGDLLAELAASLAELGATAEELRSRNEELLIAHQQLVQAKQQYEDLFEQAPTAYVVTTPGLKIERANRAAVELLRIRSGYEQGRNLIARIHPDDHAEMHRAVHSLADRDEHEWTLRLAIADEVTPIALHARAVREEGGRLESIRWTLRDLTEDLHRRDQDVRTRSLIELGEMAASVAHQIRNPLTGLRAMLEVMRARLERDDVLAPIVTEAFDTITRCDRTVAALLAFAKPWSSRTAGCNVRDVADAIASRQRNKPEPYQVDVAVVGSCQIAMDAWIAEHLLEELVENAEHALPNGGVIRLRATRRDDRVIVEVADGGTGMSPETLAKVFQPFFTTRARGTGLGLPTCRRIVEAHGGKIKVSSAPGSGTTVTIDLPAA